MIHKRLAITASLVGLTLLVGGGTALAAEQSITITPTAVNLVLKPGSTIAGSFQVLNSGRVSYPFDTSVKPYRVHGEEYTPDFTPVPGAPDVASWFSLTSPKPLIDPGQAFNVSYKITVPADTPPGGYYAVAFAATRQPQIPNSITINQLVGEIFYIEVSGTKSAGGKVASWQTSFWQHPPLSATLRLENNGSLHYFANVQIKVRDVFGNPKYSFNDSKVVLPQTTRRIGIIWPKAPPFGLYKVTGTVGIIGQTKTLPSHYVLVMSSSARRIALALLILLMVLPMVRFVRRNIMKYKRNKRS